MTRRRDLAGLAAVLLVSAVVLAAAPAEAVFNDTSASPAMSVSSAAMAAPTGVSATASCVGTIVKTPRITLAWTASSSMYATGYAILRLTGGTYVQIGTVSGRTTTTYADNTVSLATTYTYQVRTTYLSWYADSASASATTATLCL